MTEDGGETKVLESGRLLDDLREEESPPPKAPRAAGENSWTVGRALLAAATGLGLLASVATLMFVVSMARTAGRFFVVLNVELPAPTHLALTLASMCSGLGVVLPLVVLAALVVPLVTVRGRAWLAYLVTSHLVLVATLFVFLGVQISILKIQCILEERAAAERLREGPAGPAPAGSSTREP